jgi:hypothetical protein
MQEGFACFAAWMQCEDFAAELAEILEPVTKVLRELRIDFAAEALGYCGAFARGGNCDLKIAAADHGAEKEIAVGNVVDAVAWDVASDAALIDSGVDFGGVGGGDDEEIAVEIGKFEAAVGPFELAIFGELLDFGMGLGGDYAEVEAGGEEAADFLERDVACSDEKAVAVGEFQEDR